MCAACRRERPARSTGPDAPVSRYAVAHLRQVSLPRALASRRAVAGEWLLLDFGAQVDGYCATSTRTVVVGGGRPSRQRCCTDWSRGAAARADRRARRHERAGCRRARARPDRGARVRARPFATRSVTGSGSRCRKRHDSRRPTPIRCRRARVGHIEPGRVPRRRWWGCESRTTCISPAAGTGALSDGPDGPVGARVTWEHDLDIHRHLVQILGRRPSLGAIESAGVVRPGRPVRVSRPGTRPTGAASTCPGAAARTRAVRGRRLPGRGARAAPPSHLVENQVSHGGDHVYSAPEPGAEPLRQSREPGPTGQVVCIIEG